MKKTIRVAFDIVMMNAGGLNGGIKAHHYAFLKGLSEFYSDQISLLVICQPELVEELAFLSEHRNHELHIVSKWPNINYQQLGKELPHLRSHYPKNKKLLADIAADILYCGFGYSLFATEETPYISLIVDCLHNELPSHLPPPEVIFRNEWHKRVINEATLIQANSGFCKTQILKYNDVDPKKIFTTSLPIHSRFDDIEVGKLPKKLNGKKYFYYPSNYWTHKNHEGLFVAYYNYLQSFGEEAYDIVLTGFDIDRTKELKAQCESLGIISRIHFLGHLDTDTVKAVWEGSAALLFPSLYEGFGIPILEAMHFEKPIVCSKVASLPEVAGDIAIFFDPRDPIDIARALGIVTSEYTENKVQNLIHRGTERIKQFSFRREVDLLADKFIKTAEGRHS